MMKCESSKTEPKSLRRQSSSGVDMCTGMSRLARRDVVACGHPDVSLPRLSQVRCPQQTAEKLMFGKLLLLPAAGDTVARVVNALPRAYRALSKT